MASIVVSKTIDIGSNPILPVYCVGKKSAVNSNGSNVIVHYRSD